jgi:enoyl-[acyl-carrier-protein] reductase (NADH)
MPETSKMKELFEVKVKATGMTWEQFQGYLSGNHAKRAMTLDDVANTAAFVASDGASGLTGTTVNLTLGSLDD